MAGHHRSRTSGRRVPDSHSPVAARRGETRPARVEVEVIDLEPRVPERDGVPTGLEVANPADPGPGDAPTVGPDRHRLVVGTHRPDEGLVTSLELEDPEGLAGTIDEAEVVVVLVDEESDLTGHRGVADAGHHRGADRNPRRNGGERCVAELDRPGADDAESPVGEEADEIATVAAVRDRAEPVIEPCPEMVPLPAAELSRRQLELSGGPGDVVLAQRRFRGR